MVHEIGIEGMVKRITALTPDLGHAPCERLITKVVTRANDSSGDGQPPMYI